APPAPGAGRAHPVSDPAPAPAGGALRLRAHRRARGRSASPLVPPEGAEGRRPGPRPPRRPLDLLLPEPRRPGGGPGGDRRARAAPARRPRPRRARGAAGMGPADACAGPRGIRVLLSGLFRRPTDQPPVMIEGPMSGSDLRETVRAKYGEIARRVAAGGAPEPCGTGC